MENLYRIHDSILLNLQFNNVDVRPIFKHEYEPSANEGNTIQYLNLEEENNDNVELRSTVWHNSFPTVGKKLNRIWTQSNNLLNVSDLTKINSYKQFKAELLIKQGFEWDNVFGILFILKDTNSNVIYKSRLFRPVDFNIASTAEVINGVFWISSISFWLPDLFTNLNSLSFAAEVISFEDVISENDILTYPTQYEVLIPDMPLSDKVQISLSWNEYLQLEIEPKSLLDGYTLEQILKWNFSIAEINNLQLQHYVKFPADEEGNFNHYIFGNDVNPLNKIVIGLPLPPKEDPQIIEVTSLFNINGLVATRFNTIVWDKFNSINDYIGQYIATSNENQTLFPVEVHEIINITNEVINTEKDIKIAQIEVPTFIELTSTQNLIVAENKNISFSDIKQDFYIKFIFDENEDSENNPLLFSQKTIEDIYFINISEINVRLKESGKTEIPFKVYNIITNLLIKSGTITVQ